VAKHNSKKNLRNSLLILCLSLGSPAWAAKQADPLQYWKKLLHFGETHSQVISQDFFLAKNGNADPDAELAHTIQLLNSPQGRTIACRFPARYQWIRQTQKAVPQYDLHQCREIQKFKQSFQHQTLKLVFASEYLNKPVSSFGHTLLVFYDEDKPLLSADTIHFAAETQADDGFLTYTWKGFTGGYQGYFHRDPFFKKQLQYTIQEQRYIHLYTLDFNKQQIEKIIHHLYELRNARFKYYYVNQNCAYQIANLLDIASDDISFSSDGFVLPIDVIKRYKTQYTRHTVLQPVTRKIQFLLKDMPERDLGQFEQVLAGELDPDNTLPNHVKQVLYLYYDHAYRSQRIKHPNYQKVLRLKYQREKLDIPSPQPMDKPGAHRISIGHLKQDGQESALLSYRPVLQGLRDTLITEQQDFELSLFQPMVRIQDNTSYLHQFDFINLKSFPTRSYLYKPLSWQFYTGFNRNNLKQSLNYETEFGLGLSYQLSLFSMNYSINIGSDLSLGDYYYKPNITALLRLGDNFKIGIEASEKYYEHHQFITRSGFVSFTTGNHGLTLEYSQLPHLEQESMNLSYHYYF